VAEEVCEQGVKPEMEVYLQDMFLRILFFVPFGLISGFLFVQGIKRSNRFQFHNYQGKNKEKFRDNLMSSLYLALALVSLLSAIFGFLTGIHDIATFVATLPIALCIGAFIFPMMVLRSYWQSYWMNKMYGGFMPTIRAIHGYDQPDMTNQIKVDLSKVKVSRKVIVSAATIALVFFFGMAFLFPGVQGSDPAWLGILYSVFLSALGSFAIFMMIILISLSRKNQRMKNGEPEDEE